MEAWIALGLSALGSIVMWLVADSRGKGRAEVHTEQLRGQGIELAGVKADLVQSQKDIVESSQDRKAIHETLARLAAEKASKEVMEGVQEQLRDVKKDLDGQLRDLKKDIDSRFDKLERLILAGRAANDR